MHFMISALATVAVAIVIPAQSYELRGGELDTLHIKDAPDTDPPNPQFFEPAMDLEYFANLDPKKFEWVNPDEIKPGETTCGFLTAPLGWDVEEVDIVYPTVKVYVCVTFAKQQPAPRGNMAVHCGGPGSLTLCNYVMALQFDEEVKSSYNIIGFDQRGMGRSDPTFVIPECAAHMHADAKKLNVNFGNEQSIRDAAQVYKETHLACWNHPGFQLGTVQKDGTSKAFHFLEYSGTRQLAEDIERVRRIFGSQQLSIFGISYGTIVMGTYATIFSDKVNLMVLDGSVDPNSDIVSRELDDARAKQERLDYFIASCEFGNGQCGDTDVRTCLNDVSTMVDWLGEEIGDWLAPVRKVLEFFGMQTGKNIVMTTLISMIWSDFSQFSRVCEYAAKDDYGSFMDWFLAMLLGSTEYEHDLSLPFINITLGNTKFSFEYNTDSKPTSSEHADADWPFEGYGELAALTSVTQDMITAQDMAFGAYDEDRYVKFMHDLHMEYPGLGTGMPARWVQQWYSACYYWPNVTPLPPIGNPSMKGIIAGQLFDPATPYIWTQKMRDHFKSASLLTSRSVNHGISAAIESMAANKSCYANILRYLKSGRVDFVDGTVCEANHIGDSCD
mmetsp:Transcript_8226/g.14355  ORF Transcript_8226/g.14355 Transcript_8226/m.14355 type:complete len:614 (+) Transcript_8226:59-1900(+)